MIMETPLQHKGPGIDYAASLAKGSPLAVVLQQTEAAAGGESTDKRDIGLLYSLAAARGGGL